MSIMANLIDTKMVAFPFFTDFFSALFRSG